MKLGAKAGLKKVFNTFLNRSGVSNELTNKDFWALSNISLEVKRGEAVGLLGKNGAGKSTLLKHISGIYLPDSGSIHVSGHIEGLIELGAGFHPLLSGRDNILQRCSLLGLNKDELESTVQDIIEFSELEEFIDMPVQNYSSGMKARLGFASAVLGKPDVLLVDEVLSVGDFAFAQKCLKKINEIKDTAAIIFVSHSMQSMKMFCDRGVYIKNGAVQFTGDISKAIEAYYENENKKKTEDKLIDESEKKVHMGEFYTNDHYIEYYKFDWLPGNGEFFKEKEPLCLQYEVLFKDIEGLRSEDLSIGLPVWDYTERMLTAINSDRLGYTIEVKDNRVKGIIEVENVFNSGDYDVCFVLHQRSSYLLRRPVKKLVVGDRNPRDYGAIRIDATFREYE